MPLITIAQLNQKMLERRGENPYADSPKIDLNDSNWKTIGENNGKTIQVRKDAPQEDINAALMGHGPKYGSCGHKTGGCRCKKCTDARHISNLPCHKCTVAQGFNSMQLLFRHGQGLKQINLMWSDAAREAAIASRKANAKSGESETPQTPKQGIAMHDAAGIAHAKAADANLKAGNQAEAAQHMQASAEHNQAANAMRNGKPGFGGPATQKAAATSMHAKAGVDAANASGKAYGATNNAKLNGTVANHAKAAEANGAAMAAHNEAARAAGKAGDTESVKSHTAIAAQHNKAMNEHFAAKEAAAKPASNMISRFGKKLASAFGK